MPVLNFFLPSKKSSELVKDVGDITQREREEVTRNLKTMEEKNVKRGKYKHGQEKRSFKFGNYAVSNGAASTIRNLSKKYPGLSMEV